MLNICIKWHPVLFLYAEKGKMSLQYVLSQIYYKGKWMFITFFLYNTSSIHLEGFKDSCTIRSVWNKRTPKYLCVYMFGDLETWITLHHSVEIESHMKSYYFITIFHSSCYLGSCQSLPCTGRHCGMLSSL